MSGVSGVSVFVCGGRPGVTASPTHPCHPCQSNPHTSSSLVQSPSLLLPFLLRTLNNILRTVVFFGLEVQGTQRPASPYMQALTLAAWPSSLIWTWTFFSLPQTSFFPHHIVTSTFLFLVWPSPVILSSLGPCWSFVKSFQHSCHTGGPCDHRLPP